MKILFLTSGSVRSSFTHRALCLAKELRALGHDTALVCPSADKYNGFQAEKLDELEGVKIFQPRQFKSKKTEINLLPYIFGALYRTLREKPDLVYIYKPTPASIVGLAAKFLRNTPVVLDMDDLGSEVMKVEGHPWHQRVLVGYCERMAARYADRIVVASSYLFEKYAENYPDKPLYIMPNGIDKDWLAPVTATDKEMRIVYMGSLNRKNIVEPLFDVMPYILKKHPAAELLVMGDGKYFGYFQDKATALEIDGQVTFTGWLPLEKARERLHAGDLGYGFMPDEITTRAASNMKTPQYMIRGVVPFVSKTGDLPETVDEGRAGYIAESERINDVRDAILSALEDPQRKGAKAIAARDFASLHFSWKKLASDFDTWIKRPADDAGRKAEIFFVTSSVPGNVGGAEIRNLHLMRSVQASGRKVRLFCLRSGADLEAIDAIHKDAGIAVTSARTPGYSGKIILSAFLGRIQPFMERFRQSGLGNEVRAAADKELPLAIQLEQLDAYHMIRPHVAYLKQRGVKIILDCHNVEAQAFQGSLKSFPLAKRWVGAMFSSRLRTLEIEAAKNADAIFACSEKDMRYFQRYNPHVYLVPNGVDCDFFSPAEAEKDLSLIFIGGTNYAPNADALRHYLKEIHPRVRASLPQTKITAIGATDGFLRDHGIEDPTVIAPGFVDDIRPYLEHAAVGICPIRYGSGTRLKILTFMACGLPVVSTKKGAEGISYAEGEDIVIASTAERFAQDIIALLRDPSRRREMGKKARARMVEDYHWKKIGEKVKTAYQEIFAACPAPAADRLDTLSESLISEKIA